MLSLKKWVAMISAVFRIAEMEGNIMVKYSPVETGGRLVSVDFSNISFDKKQIEWFLGFVPVVFVQEIEKGHGNVSVELIYNVVTFDDFWKPVIKKVNKSRCIIEWDKLKTEDKHRAIAGYKNYRRYLERNTWRSEADPEQYLKKRFWDTDWDRI